MNIQGEITNAMLNVDASPGARELVDPLVSAYIENMPGFPDTNWKTLAVEIPWRYQLAENIWLVGVLDRIAEDQNGQIIGCEWKTRRAPRFRKDGAPFPGEDERDWLLEISTGAQLAIYALALKRADFIARDPEALNTDLPRILVRACIKSLPPMFWPTQFETGIFSFTDAYLDHVEMALISKGSQLRSALRLRALPWQLPGLHCVNKYRRFCEYHSFCLEQQTPEFNVTSVFNENDPGFSAMADIPIEPGTIILSASSHATACQCAEKYRIITRTDALQGSSEALETGRVYHAALAEIYRLTMPGHGNIIEKLKDGKF